MRMKGEQVTPRYLERHGFSFPIRVTEMEGLGLKLPSPSFSVQDVERYVGESDPDPGPESDSEPDPESDPGLLVFKNSWSRV